MLEPDFWSVWNVILYQPFQAGAGSAEATGASTNDPAASAAASAVLTLMGQRLHTPLTIFAQTAPGCAGLTVGENDGPAGPMAFSVGVLIEEIGRTHV